MINRKLLLITIVVLILFSISACSAPLAALSQQVSSIISRQSSVAKTNDEVMQEIAEDNQDAVNSLNLTEPIDSGLITAYQSTLEEIYEQVNPQVVNISVLIKQSDLTSGLPDLPFDLPSSPGLPGHESIPEDNSSEEGIPFYSQAAGSGFIWDNDGHIITNNHVVSGAVDIDVTFSDGTTVPAKIIGSDSDSDLAVLKVDVPENLLKSVQLADPDQIRVGQLAIAIGNPFGLDGTMTVGIVSAMGRTLPVVDGFQGGPRYSIPEIIQTDAPINPGNSGGVLVNSEGHVIGVTSAIESPVRANAGVGFAIPVSIVEKVVPILIEDGKFVHPFLGVSGLSLTPDIAEAMGLEINQRGALIVDVLYNSPADNAGLQAGDQDVEINGQQIEVGGDVVIAIDDQDVREMDDLIAYLATNTVVGQEVALTILRNGSQDVILVTLGERPDANQNQISSDYGQEQKSRKVYLGILGREINSNIADAIGLPKDQKGILVLEVEKGSPADRANLRGGKTSVVIDEDVVLIGGDLIIGFDGKEITDFPSLLDLLTKSEDGQTVELIILRDGEEMQVDVTLAAR